MAFLEDEVSVRSVDSSSSGRIKFLCSFGGKIMARPADNQLRYMGGETRILAVGRNISYLELMEKLVNLCGSDHISVKYQLPGEDLDALVSLICDDDVEIMMEEYERLETIDVSVRLRLFMFQSDKKVISNDAMEKARALKAKEQAKDVETIIQGASPVKKVQNYQATRVSEYLMGQQAPLAPGMVVGRQQVFSPYCSPYVPVVGQVNPLVAGHSVPPGAVFKQLSSMTLAPVVNPALMNQVIPPVVNNPVSAMANPMVSPIQAVVPNLAPLVNPALLNPAVVNTPVSAMANPVLSVNPLVNPVPAVVNTPVSGFVNPVLSVNPVSAMVNPAVSVSPLANPIPPVSAMANPVASAKPLVNPVPSVPAMENSMASANSLVNPGSIPPVIDNPVSAMVNPVASVNPLVNPVPSVSALVNPAASVTPVSPVANPVHSVNPVSRIVNPNPPLVNNPVSAMVNPANSVNPMGNPVPVSAMVNPVAPVIPLVPPVSALVNPATSVYVPNAPVAEDTQGHLKGAALRKSRGEVVAVLYQDGQAASRASTTLLSAASHAMNVSHQGLMRSGSESQYFQGSPRSGSGSAHSSFSSRFESEDIARQALACNEEFVIHSAAPAAQVYYPEKVSAASHAMNMSQQRLMRLGSEPQYLQGFPRSGSGSAHAGFPRSGSGSTHHSFSSRAESEDIAREALACNEERVIHSAAPAVQVYYPEKVSRQYVPVHHFKDRIAP